MSDALTPEAPEPQAEVPSVEDPTPVDGTAVASGSAGTTETKMVEVERFNGLMSSHQRALADLENERQLRVALEARLTQQETVQVADDSTVEEVRALREELALERLEAAKAKALDKYPAARPLADLIVGTTAREIEDVTAAIATRLQTLIPAATETAPAEEVATEQAAETPAAEAAVAPVTAGGAAAPVVDEDATAKRQEALAKGDWNAFWEAGAGQVATANLS